jgi:hypothetical protein
MAAAVSSVGNAWRDWLQMAVTISSLLVKYR